MLRYASVAFALALASCSTQKSQPPTDTTGGNTPQPGAATPSGDGGAQVASTCGFVSASTSYALPTLPGEPALPFAAPALGDSIACQIPSSFFTYALYDLDADGRLDLVVTSSCADATVGVSVWLVYFGAATGFAATATRFALPPASPAGCATVSLFDVDGDQLPDYVVTSLCSDATIGTSRWFVYPNTHAGFATTPVSYALPPGASAGAFKTTSVATENCASGANAPAYQVFDIDGDGKLDFVVTAACGDASIGTSAWSVYAGTSAGASQTPTRFTLPTTPAVTAGAFAQTTGTLLCTAGVSKPQFGLIDFDADGKLDMVVTQECNDASVGTNVWLYFHNVGNGFATSTTIALPEIAGLPAGSFPSFAATGKCASGAGTPSYTLLDANGDGLPDLFVTTDCSDALTGSSYWQLFANAGSGFASSYRAFTLPSALDATAVSLAGLTGASQCKSAPTRPAYTTTYLEGFALDVVVTASCTDATVGQTQWELFAASCK